MKHLLLLFILCIAVSCTSKFYIAPKMADCVIAGRSSCYLVKTSLTENWLMIPEEIYGFEYEEGFLYRIKVRNIKIKDDFNSRKNAYQLVEILSREEFKGKKISANSLQINNRQMGVELHGHDLSGTVAFYLTCR